MIARVITWKGKKTGLLVAQPNWETELTISLELPTDIAKEPITFNESRRTFAQSARYTMEWRAYLPSAKEATELRIFFQRIRGENILVPLWPDACELSSSIPVGTTIINLVDAPGRFGANWIIANDNFSSWEIVTGTFGFGRLTIAPGTTHSWPAGTLVYPLILGRFTDRPKPESITDETMEVDIKIKENSQFAERVSPPAAALPLVGSHIPAFATTPLWNIAPNHVRPLDWTEMPDVVYQQIGFLRQEQQRAYDHRNARGLELEFYQNTRASVAAIERFFRDRRGTTLRFMLPTWRGDMRMLADTPVPLTPKWIRVEPSEVGDIGREIQPGDSYVALIGSNDVVDPYQLSSIQHTEVEERLIATMNVGAHTAATTIVSNLLLARFSESTLQWTYTTPYLATTRIKFRELPHEYNNPPAPLPEPAFLFGFIEVGVRIDRFTSYENTIVIPSGVYAGTYPPAPFSFNTVKTGLKLDEEKLDFKSFRFDGNPLNKMWPFGLDGTLIVYIVEVDARNPQTTTAIYRFSGEVWTIDSDYNATAIAFGSLFQRKFPRFLLSPSDNFVQFSPPTKIPASAFKVTGTNTSRNVQTITITGAPSTKPDDYFAGGWLETGVGANIEKRGILHNSGSTFHIDRPLLKATGNPSIDCYPGYDGSIDQCESRFNNRINFGGHPYIPDVNPAVKAMKPKQVQGGKKG